MDSSASAENAVTAIGTSCRDSSRLRAVTTISSSDTALPVCATATGGAAMAPVSAAAMVILRRWLSGFI